LSLFSLSASLILARLDSSGSCVVVVVAGAPWAESCSRSLPPYTIIIITVKNVHASRRFLFSSANHMDSTILRVLFLRSCWPDCTLSLHALLGFRRPGGDPVVSDHCSPFPGERSRRSLVNSSCGVHSQFDRFHPPCPGGFLTPPALAYLLLLLT
jgi:hypothetical protein